MPAVETQSRKVTSAVGEEITVSEFKYSVSQQGKNEEITMRKVYCTRSTEDRYLDMRIQPQWACETCDQYGTEAV